MTKNIVLGFTLLMLVLALLFSDRPWVLYSRPALATVETLPASADKAGLSAYTVNYGMFVHRPKSKALVAGEAAVAISSAIRNGTDGRENMFDHDYGMGEPAVGYSMREWGIFGMPMLAVKELGLVAYVERNDREGSWQVPLEGEGAALLEKQIGHKPGQGFIYPYWVHVWGWLFLAGAALYLWLRFREIRARRAAEGLI